MIRALSLGWGVQSFTVAAMAAKGELEQIDVVLHADTTHEKTATYEFAKKWTPWLEKMGVEVATVSNDKNIVGEYGGIVIPAFTKTDARVGMLRRQCTYRWKIRPIRRYLRDHYKGEIIELLLGISLDEALRMRESNVQYINHRWPLVEMRMSRLDCINWLTKNGLEIPPKSACYFCPFHDRSEWMELRSDGRDWDRAIEFDEQVRKMRPPFDLFIHRDAIPLSQVDMRTDAERTGQLSLWDNECLGYCGV